MQLRDYQEEAVAFLLPRLRALIHCPAGGGKTRIAAAALSRRVWPGAVVHWVANTVEQRQQASEALQSTPCPHECSIYLHCAAALPDVSGADILVIDECHHIPAATWLCLLEKLRPACIVWGLTATPDHPDPARDAIVSGTFREVFQIGRERLVAAGHLMQGRVFMHDLDVEGCYDEAIAAETAVLLKERMRKFPYLDMWEQRRRIQNQVTQEFIQKNENRNSGIKALASRAVAAGDSGLLLVASIDHGTLLAQGIPQAVIVHSKIGKKARAQIIEDFRAGRLGCLVSTSLADEGLDVPRASVLVLAAGGRSSGKLEQRAGRVLRPFEGKKAGIIHDFLDRGAAMAYAQAKARMRTYETLGYPVEHVTYR